MAGADHLQDMIFPPKAQGLHPSLDQMASFLLAFVYVGPGKMAEVFAERLFQEGSLTGRIAARTNPPGRA